MDLRDAILESANYGVGDHNRIDEITPELEPLLEAAENILEQAPEGVEVIPLFFMGNVTVGISAPARGIYGKGISTIQVRFRRWDGGIYYFVRWAVHGRYIDETDYPEEALEAAQWVAS